MAPEQLAQLTVSATILDADATCVLAVTQRDDGWVVAVDADVPPHWGDAIRRLPPEGLLVTHDSMLCLARTILRYAGEEAYPLARMLLRYVSPGE